MEISSGNFSPSAPGCGEAEISLCVSVFLVLGSPFDPCPLQGSFPSIFKLKKSPNLCALGALSLGLAPSCAGGLQSSSLCAISTGFYSGY